MLHLNLLIFASLALYVVAMHEEMAHDMFLKEYEIKKLSKNVIIIDEQVQS